MTLQDQLRELQTAMKETNDRRLYERYQAVFLSLSGYKRKDVAHIIGRTRQTVGTYVHVYQEEGLEGLKPGSSTGKPKKLTNEQEETLATVIINHLPLDVGFKNKANWTLSLVVQYVEREWNVSYTLRGMSIVLERLGLSYTRPTYTLAKADPEKQREFREETFPQLKKTDF